MKVTNPGSAPAANVVRARRGAGKLQVSRRRAGGAFDEGIAQPPRGFWAICRRARPAR